MLDRACALINSEHLRTEDNMNALPDGITLDEMTMEDYELWLADSSLGVSPHFDTRDRIAAYLARNPGLSTVARLDGRIIGAALCGHDGRRGSIYHVAVAEQHRRLGIGRRMVA
jgi:ribosomal protein S18 acetylase RimI-like enzyme